MTIIIDGTTGVPVSPVTGTLAVANGGTGVTTSTGSGAVVLGTSPTLTAPALGTPASGVLTNCTGVVAGALPAGSVLQVVNGSYATIASNNTSTFTTTGLTATITPRSTSSKILVFANVVGVNKGAANTSIMLRLYRGVSSIIGFEDFGAYTGGAIVNAIGSCSTTYLDSPATTSSTTYTVYFASASNISSVVVQNYNATQANSTSTITLMEIQG